MEFSDLQRRLKRLTDHELTKIEDKIMKRLGTLFLKMVRDQLKKLGFVDSKATLNSFMKGKRGNVWKLDKDRDSFTIEVGSMFHVARFLDDGYTISEPHFVPGYFQDGKFIYESYGKAIGVKRGVWMKPRSFIGKHYIDMTLEGFQGGMVSLIDSLFQKELDRMGL